MSMNTRTPKAVGTPADSCPTWADMASQDDTLVEEAEESDDPHQLPNCAWHWCSVAHEGPVQGKFVELLLSTEALEDQSHPKDKE